MVNVVKRGYPVQIGFYNLSVNGEYEYLRNMFVC